MSILKKLFGSNEKEIRKLQPLVDQINSWEASIQKLSDEELRAKTAELKKRLSQPLSKQEETMEDVLPEAFAMVREAAYRVIGERHFDVQLLGGIVLHKGKIAEMKTGEGKTLTSTLPIYLNALSGRGVHVVTVNDYLAKRDCNWMGSIFHFLGISTACIIHDASYLYEPKIIDSEETSVEMQNLKHITRREAYAADVTYGTNNEFGFDYLRDNMVQTASQMTQREFNFAIVDEVDSILIDEARTPLIISAPDSESTKLYQQFAQLVPRLREEDFEVDEKMKTVTIKETGISKIENWLGVGNIYETGKINYVHHLEQALKAQVIFQRDRDYVVKDGEVIIVDDFTGRLMPGRRYSEGLHQAIEAKEGVEVQRESRTMATITFQNYFRLYKKLSGMTGTALTSAEEFFKVYGIEVMEIPTNKPMIRKDLPDVIYKTEKGKFAAIAQKIKETSQNGQPLLVGTIAIEKSEYLSALLTRQGIAHEVLNAKNHEKEAQIIVRAGQQGSVTIATNMAGRGTDIKLGAGVRELGGLLVIGTERHEARRIDNQLRGRAGRQGDPGASEFYVSLEDELMRRFGGDKLKNMMDSLGLPEDQPIQNGIISHSIESAQSKIEGFNFDIRKHILEYDDVMNKQREVIYKKRSKILKSADTKSLILSNIKEIIERMVSLHSAGDEDQWNIPELIENFNALLNFANLEIQKKIEQIRDDKKWNLSEKITEVNQYLFELAKLAYNKKEQEISPEQMRVIEKAVVLQIIDLNWINHLEETDYLREGIGLRGYGQRDPLTEYKREAFDLFYNLLGNISYSSVRTIFRISLGVSPQESSQKKSALNYKGAEEVEQFGAAKKSGEPSTEKSSPIVNKDKVGRNDPCPCGAKKDDGTPKKYKHCCGK